jgi:hypothetical protein
MPIPTEAPAAASPRIAAWAALLVALVVAAALAGRWVPDSAAGVTDFVEYRAAATLLLAGEDPYDPAKLHPIQKAVGWPFEKADMMWNPPWVFPVVLPTGLLPWGSGLLAWGVLQLGVVLLSAGLVWRVSGGPDRLLWVALAVAVVFVPTFFLVRLGQVSGLLLLGLAGFAAAMRAGRPGLAGAAAALTAVKPHLFLPFAVLLACDAFVSRATRRAVLVGAAVLGLCAAFPLAWNPDVWRQYFEAVRAPSSAYHHAPSDWKPPTLSAELREATGGGLAVQFAPSVVTTAVLVGYWLVTVRRGRWDWSRELPLVTLVSVLATGYGAWGFDLVILLLPVVQAATWLADGSRPRLALWSAAGFLAFNAAAFVGMVSVLWWAPVVAVGYVALALTLPSGRTGPAPACRG